MLLLLPPYRFYYTCFPCHSSSPSVVYHPSGRQKIHHCLYLFPCLYFRCLSYMLFHIHWSHIKQTYKVLLLNIKHKFLRQRKGKLYHYILLYITLPTVLSLFLIFQVLYLFLYIWRISFNKFSSKSVCISTILLKNIFVIYRFLVYIYAHISILYCI